METVTYDVVRAVAAEKGLPAGELSPLNDHVDADALERIFEAAPPGVERSLSVQFRYEGYTVTVRTGGRIELSEAGLND